MARSSISHPRSAPHALKCAEFRLQETPRANQVLENRYRIAGFMDSGGTAEIFLAEDLEKGELVVVKQLTEELAGNPEVKSRFLHEATAAEAIQHPNVVQVRAVVEPLDQPPFLVMEALIGETLGDALRREEQLAVPQALEIIAEVSAALAATHEAGVIHRDVKPDNIFLLGKRGEPCGVKLIDFGMAKIKTVACTGGPVVL